MCCGPRRAEKKNTCGAVATPKGGGGGGGGGGGYMDGTSGGDAPESLGRIFMSRLQLASVHTSFSPYLAFRGIDGSVGSTRGLFLDLVSTTFGDGERRRSGELLEDNSSSAGRSMSSGTTASLPL